MSHELAKGKTLKRQTIKIVNSSRGGRAYLAVDVAAQDIVEYIEIFRTLCPNDYLEAQENKFRRDGREYHITVLEPGEIDAKHLRQRFDQFGGVFDVHIQGIGRVEVEGKKAFYLIVNSPALDALRESMGFGPKDLHITIGFLGSDIYGVPKDKSTMIWPTHNGGHFDDLSLPFDSDVRFADSGN